MRWRLHSTDSCDLCLSSGRHCRCCRCRCARLARRCRDQAADPAAGLPCRGRQQVRAARRKLAKSEAPRHCCPSGSVLHQIRQLSLPGQSGPSASTLRRSEKCASCSTGPWLKGWAEGTVACGATGKPVSADSVAAAGRGASTDAEQEEACLVKEYGADVRPTDCRLKSCRRSGSRSIPERKSAGGLFSSSKSLLDPGQPKPRPLNHHTL